MEQIRRQVEDLAWRRAWSNIETELSKRLDMHLDILITQRLWHQIESQTEQVDRRRVYGYGRSDPEERI